MELLGVSLFVVPDPPFIWRSLRISFRRVLPLFLTPECSQIKVAPSAPHGLVATVVDEVGAEHAVAGADERVRTVPLVYAEVSIEVVRYGIPGHLPSHTCLNAL